eukprot:3852804-Rhodomonas_salina.1
MKEQEGREEERVAWDAGPPGVDEAHAPDGVAPVPAHMHPTALHFQMPQNVWLAAASSWHRMRHMMLSRARWRGACPRPSNETQQTQRQRVTGEFRALDCNAALQRPQHGAGTRTVGSRPGEELSCA